MKYNKGFAPLVVLLIVLGVLAVGGVAYFAGKSSAPKNEVADNSNYTSPITNNNPPAQTPPPQNPKQPTPLPLCVPSITVLSPNGGEVYIAGQQITVKWTSCNVPTTNQDVLLYLLNYSQNGTGYSIGNSTVNDGTEVVTLPNNPQQPGKYYKIRISLFPVAMGGSNLEDDSDNLFTINAPVSTTISSPYITGTKWLPTIQTSSTAYSCISSSSESSEVSTVVQKVINGKTYCVSTTIDGGAGHFGGDYIYTRANGSGTKTAIFQLQWNNCGGYGGPGDTQYDQCKIDQANVFSNLDAMVDSLM